MYDYNINKQQLFDATNAEFRKYFLENWESCVEMWAAFKRDQYMHFGNTTNNRLESHNQKLKDVTSRTSTLSEMFNNVVLFAQTCESEYKYSTFNEEFKVMKSSYHQSIKGCSEVEAICIQYASNKISEQMKLATSVQYVFSQREGIVEVTSPNKPVYFVKPSDDITCTCTFYKTMFMPCRHIFAARRLLQLPLFPLSMVPQHWIKQYQLSIEEESHVQSNSQAPDVKISLFTRKALATCTLFSRSQKYNKMMSLCQKLATAALLCGMPDFRKKYEDIEDIVQHWEQNGDYTVTRQIMDVSNGPGYDQGSRPAFSGDITTLECVSTANGPRYGNVNRT